MKTNRVKSNEKKGIATDASANAISYADVQRRIICVRELPVILDADVAELYGVETKRVNEAVRNNLAKFPPDYMFELDIEALLLGHAGHMHEARAVGSGHVLGTSLNMALYLVAPHLSRDGGLFNGEHASKAAALVGTVGFDDVYAVH